MTEVLFFIEVVVAGLLAGTMYSLVALGFVLIYKASSTFNFAQGASGVQQQTGMATAASAVEGSQRQMKDCILLKLKL